MTLMRGLLAPTIAAAALLPAIAITQDAPPLFKGLGNYHRAVRTSNPLAKKYFDQGLVQMYAFHKGEAAKSFQYAAKLDPNCAMAWWGLSIAVGPDINVPAMEEEKAKIAIDALSHARKAAKTTLENELVAAASKRYASPTPDDRSALDKAYADAMRQVWKAHPKDPDVGSLFAESMLDLSPWHQWNSDGSPLDGTNEVLATLKSVLAMSPKHPMGNHLWIHAVEGSKHPEMALKAANLLCNLQPALGHMVHMPSHIYVRTGRWPEAIVQNEKAIAMDNEYMKKRKPLNEYPMYMAHNRMMLAYAATMIGESGKAMKYSSEVEHLFPKEALVAQAGFFDGAIYMPLELMKRFGKWNEILAYPEFPDAFPLSKAMRHGERAIAYSVLGKPDEAAAEQKAFIEAKGKVPEKWTAGNNAAADILAIEEHQMIGELLFKAGKQEEGLAELRKAVAGEDQLRYDEPPDWIQPTRHTLGAALVDAGKFEEAEKVYREDLAMLPNNGWSLLGLSRALDGEHKAADAAKFKALYAKAWKNADFKITSSCMCLPAK